MFRVLLYNAQTLRRQIGRPTSRIHQNSRHQVLHHLIIIRCIELRPLQDIWNQCCELFLAITDGSVVWNKFVKVK